MTDLTEIRRRAIIACEAEAVSLGYGPEVGREIYGGICRDHLERWTDDDYLQWSRELSAMHGRDVIQLYGRINLRVYPIYYQMAVRAVVGGL